MRKKRNLTPREAVEHMDGFVAVKTLADYRYIYRKTGHNPGPRFLKSRGRSGRIIYRVDDLDTWMRALEIESDAAPNVRVQS